MAYLSKVNIQGNDILVKDTEARNDITQTNSNLAQEVLDRQAADTALGGRIDDEILDRQAADTALGGRIDDEILDRQAADTALGGRIDDEILDRQAADTAIMNLITPLAETGYAVWIGDSYTGAASLGEQQLTHRFSKLVSDALNVIEKNYAVGGSGYLTGTTYPQQVTMAIGDFTSNNIDPAQCKYVFFCGCRNDGVQPTKPSMLNAAVTAFTTARSFFQKAKIVVIPVLWDYTFAPVGYTFNENILAEAFNSITGNCLLVNNAYTWLTGEAAHILYQNGAKVHPDAVGHNMIAHHILSTLNGYQYGKPTHVKIEGSALTADVANWGGEITKTDRTMRIHGRFTVNNVNAVELIIWHVSSLFFTDWYTGDQRFWIDIIPRDAGDTVKAFFECVTTYTAEGVGSITLTLRKYSGTLVNGKQYYFDIEAPLGIVKNEFSIS